MALDAPLLTRLRNTPIIVWSLNELTTRVVVRLASEEGIEEPIICSYNSVEGTITFQDLNTLTGLLCYYTADLIPVAGGYVYSFFQSKRWRHPDTI